MTEKEQIRDHIIGGASIIEACENADIEALIEEGDLELASLCQLIDNKAQELVDILGVFEDGVEG